MLEDRLTHYEEMGVERDDLNPKYAIRMWPLIVFSFVSWGLLLGVVTVAECATEAPAEGPLCAVSHVATQWGSLVHVNVVILLISFGLFFKNRRSRKAPCVLAILCYMVSLADVLIVRKFMDKALGLPSILMFLLWMLFVDVDVWKAINSRVLTRGSRMRMPRALILVSFFFTITIVFVFIARFLNEQQYAIEIICWCISACVALIYLTLLSIHLRKVKIMLYNSAT